MQILTNVKLVFEDIDTGKETVIEKHNVTCTVGMESVASRLAGGSTGLITYMGLGTGSVDGGNAPSAGDTTLNDELYRKQISTATVDSVEVTFRTFYNTSEAIGTLTEIGLFGDDATATVDTGTLFARVAFSKEKTDQETLTVDWAVTIS